MKSGISHDEIIALACGAGVALLAVRMLIRGFSRAVHQAAHASAIEVARRAAVPAPKPRRSRKIAALAAIGGGGFWAYETFGRHPAAKPATAAAKPATSTVVHKTVTQVVHVVHFPLTGTQIMVVAIVAIVLATAYMINRARSV
jgi:hypothetical protein